MQGLKRASAVVIDTHIWIWESAGDLRVESFREYRGRQILPAICVWEAAILVAKGRLELKPNVESWVARNLESPVELEPLSAEIGVRSTQLADFHGDPADRLIVATALVLQMPLVTADTQIHRWNAKSAQLDLITI